MSKKIKGVKRVKGKKLKKTLSYIAYQVLNGVSDR